jgi:hypothetical protein
MGNKENLYPYKKWENKCTCSGVTLSGVISFFRHAKSCPLYAQGAKEWKA